MPVNKSSNELSNEFSRKKKRKESRDSVFLRKSANQRKTRILAYFRQFEKTYPLQNLIL